MNFNEYGLWAYPKEPTSARELEYMRKMRNPYIETDKNTFKTSEIVSQMLIESRCSEKKSDRQFIISLIISVSTLLFAAASFFVAL